MKRSWRGWRRPAAGMAGSVVVLLATAALATEVVLKDGRILRGRTGETVGLTEQNGASEGDALKQIVFVNDDFRLIFISKRQIAAVRPDTSLENAEKFELDQPRERVGRSGRQKVMSVGPPAGPLKEFDEWGRRIYPMRTAGGLLNVVQVITELTPQYARVEALLQTWDMRIATSTLSDGLLDKILMHQINPKNLDHRRKIVRFYLQCKRYSMAVAALQKIIQDFKEDTQVAQDLQPTLQKLRVMYAQQMLDELGLRQESGQHVLVRKIFKDFPTEDVPGEILQTVAQVQRAYTEFDAKQKAIDGACQSLILQVQERADRAELATALREMGPGLNPEMLPRMAAFLQNQNGAFKAEEKLSLAVSGWLLGADDASTDLPTTLSAWRLRGLVQKYLAEPVLLKRDRLLHSILSEAAAKPEVLAALAAHMIPPYPVLDSIDENIPGYSKLRIGVIPGQPDATYYVQLPPEYNPQRRYPMIVSLHGIGFDPTMQIEWWAGEHKPDRPGRQGQAGRYGYIVIAPAWTVEHQKEYEYSAREHAFVLGCVRDACRRFAVDSDRVFLSGHMEGGDAAWDIGVSHPDLWAGVIPISAEARKTCAFYTENARLVPFYVVLGELDGGRIARDALVLDRYLKNGYNTTVVEYLGRGHEHFIDEQLPLFDWMSRCKRSFPLPRERELMHDREFACQTMRTSDNFFWWAEIESLPPNSTATGWTTPHEAKPYTTGSGLTAPGGTGAVPSLPLPAGVRPLLVRGNVPSSNTLVLTAGNSRTTIWLSPEMVDFKSRVNITVGGRRPNGVPAMIKPSVETMLEDLRIRGDRQHPFWAKVETR
ncbi:MAG: peptidase [Thermoguttaceae bacterium]